MAAPDLCQYCLPEPPARYQPHGTCHSSATEDAAAVCVPYLMQLVLFGQKVFVPLLLFTNVAQLVKNLPARQETIFRFLGWEVPLEKLPTPVFLGFPGGSGGKESACNVGDLGSIPGLGRCPGDGDGKYACLENPVDRGAWWATVHGVAKSWTRLRD